MRTNWRVLLLLVASCAPAEFTNPLTPPGKATPDKALLGKWKEVGGNGLSVEVSSKSGGVMSFALPMEGKAPEHFEGHVTMVGAMKVLNLRAVGGELESGRYLYARYELSADGRVTFWLMRDSTFRKAVQSGALEGHSTGSPGSLIVSDTPENVLRFIKSQKSDELWDKLAVFGR